MKNPTVKKGDLILLKKCRDNVPAKWFNTPLKVTQVENDNFYVRLPNDFVSGSINIYMTKAVNDVYCMAGRKEQTEYVQGQIDELEKQLNKLKKEHEHLTKYDSEEEFVAEKIQKLMKSKSKTAMVEILKELKHSNML